MLLLLLLLLFAFAARKQFDCFKREMFNTFCLFTLDILVVVVACFSLLVFFLLADRASLIAAVNVNVNKK